MNRTPAQQRAIDSDSPRILCVAGPGSGKTSTSVERIRRLMAAGTDPERIVAITFTNAAANETVKRLGTTLHVNGDESMPPQPFALAHCGTLHSFALRMLKQYGAHLGYGPKMGVITPESAAEVMAARAQQMKCAEPTKKLMEMKAAGLPQGKFLSKAELTVQAFYRQLKESGIVDFDILLTEFAELLTTPSVIIGQQFDHLFVDEVQDSGGIDWRIYDALPIKNKFLVGDSDQSIYGFRKAKVRLMQEFARRPGTEVITLEENFRSTTEICDSAQSLIQRNTDRIDKQTRSMRGMGGKVAVFQASANEGEEIGVVARHVRGLLDIGMAAQEVMILARTNAIIHAATKTFKASGLPLDIPEMPRTPRDLPFALALINVLANPDNDLAAYFFLLAKGQRLNLDAKEARRIADQQRLRAQSNRATLNSSFLLFPPHTAAGDAIKWLHKEGASAEVGMYVAERLAALPKDATLLDLSLALSHPPEQPTRAARGIRCLTIHGAKGLEADVVVMMGCEEEVTPGRRKDADIAEERRIFYVGATRARRELYVTHCSSRVTEWGAVEKHRRSRFVAELLGEPVRL